MNKTSTTNVDVITLPIEESSSSMITTIHVVSTTQNNTNVTATATAAATANTTGTVESSVSAKATIPVEAIIGIAAVGGSALLVLLVVIVVLVVKRKTKHSKAQQPREESRTDSGGTELKPTIVNKSIYSGIGDNPFFDLKSNDGDQRKSVYSAAPPPASVYDDTERLRIGTGVYTTAPPLASVYGEAPSSVRSTVYIPPESPLDE